MKKNIRKTNDITIGLITPSAPAPALFPTRFERGVNNLKSVGFKVKVGKYTVEKNGDTSAEAKKRAEDINQMFSDDDISLLMATIGGDYSAEILQYLDWDIISKNKKGLIGYSDITVLLLAIGVKTRQIVYYGPTLMTEFAEYPVPPYMSIEAFQKIFDRNANIEIVPTEKLYEKGNDWSLSPTERKLSCPVLPKTIRSGCVSGIVIGGCIEALERIRGTEYFPNFRDAILIMETSDELFDRKKWRAVITDYANMGIFRNVAGIVIGQKMWKEDEVSILSEMLLAATKEREIPIAYGLPFGHISPIVTLPLFTRATLDADSVKLVYDMPFKYEYE